MMPRKAFFICLIGSFRRKKALFLATAFLSLHCVSAHAGWFEGDAPAPLIPATGIAFDAAFSPRDDVASHVVNEILTARKSIHVAAKTFVSKPVSEALLKAYRQGIEVRVVLDAGSNKTGYSAAPFLLSMGVTAPHITKPCVTLSGGYIIVDDKDVVLGNIAGLPDEMEEKNTRTQALIIHNSPELASKYLADWKEIWAASDVMKREN